MLYRLTFTNQTMPCCKVDLYELCKNRALIFKAQLTFMKWLAWLTFMSKVYTYLLYSYRPTTPGSEGY